MSAPIRATVVMTWDRMKNFNDALKVKLLEQMIARKTSFGIGILLLGLFLLPIAVCASNEPAFWQVDRFGQGERGDLQVRTEGHARAAASDTGALHVSGVAGEYAKLLISKSFKDAPYPTKVEAVFELPKQGASGQIVFGVVDEVTGASVRVMWSQNQCAWAVSEDKEWKGWQRYVPTEKIGNRVSLVIAKVSVDTFRVFVNGKPLSGNLTVSYLHTINKVDFTADVTGSFDLIALSAYSDLDLVRRDIRLKSVDVELLARSKSPVATNPNANGYQIAYFERGFADGMNDPERRSEFVERLRELNPSSLRFPGGTWAYWYSSLSAKSVQAFAKLDRAPYFTHGTNYGWSDDDYFLGICKELDVTAIYQLNIGTWYDPKTNRAYRLLPFDRRMRDGLTAERVMQSAEASGAVDVIPEMKDVEPAFMKDALANAVALARKAKTMGVDVIWEFGNEDYVNFRPETYVRQARAFYDAIRSVDPDAQFAFCADGDSWSDRTWDKAVYAELVKAGMTDMAEASTHMYLTGGGGGPRTNGIEVYRATLSAWDTLRHMHVGMRKRLDAAGLTDANISLTEFNTVHLVKGYTGTGLEHSMGRALGEAAIWPDFIRRFNHIVFHDLIRNGYGSGTWFSRMDYMPTNPEGQRYRLPLDGKVMAVMHAHATNQILYADETLVVSQGVNGLLVSIGNVEPDSVSYNIDLRGRTVSVRGEAAWQCMTVADLGSPAYSAFTLPLEMDGDTLSFTAPAFSFSHIYLPLQ